MGNSAFGNVLTGTHNSSCMDQMNTVLYRAKTSVRINIYHSCLEVKMKFDDFSFLDGEQASLAEIET